MGSLVLEIQKEALDLNCNMTNLLKKAYVAAKKLNLNEFEEWLNLELNGYFKEKEKIPEYRKVQCSLMGWNQYRGWEEVVWQNDNPYDHQYSTDNSSIIQICEPISTFEVNNKNTTGDFMISLSPESQAKLNSTSNYPTNYAYKLNGAAVKTILSRVNNAVLDWSLELEKQGILGEDMSFNDKEKEKASSSTTINNFFNGDVNNSQIQQNTSNSSQSISIDQVDLESIQQLVSMINDNMSSLPIDASDLTVISEQLQEITTELKSETPQKSILSSCFTAIKDTLLNKVCDVVASGLIYEIEKLAVLS